MIAGWATILIQLPRYLALPGSGGLERNGSGDSPKMTVGMVMIRVPFPQLRLHFNRSSMRGQQSLRGKFTILEHSREATAIGQSASYTLERQPGRTLRTQNPTILCTRVARYWAVRL